MKRLAIFFLLLYFCVSYCYSKRYRYPVFDRTDNYKFHIDSVEITKDSTYLFFSYSGESGEWINISAESYIRVPKSGKKYTIGNAKGIPFQPEKRRFVYAQKVKIVMSFSSIGKIAKFDFIENEKDSTSFNIFGIDLSCSPYLQVYDDYEVLRNMKQRDFYNQIGNNEKAIVFCNSSLEGNKYLFGLHSPQVGKNLYILSSLFHQVGRYREAIERGKEGLSIDQSNNLADDILVSDYNNLSHSYSAIGDYKSAIELAIESKKLLAKTDTVSENYAAVLTNLSKFSNGLGNYSEALLYAKQSLFIKENTVGVDSESYAISLLNYATAESNLGNFEEAIKMLQRSLETFLKYKGEDYIDNAIIWGNLSYNHARLGNYQDAIICGKKACRIFTINHVENADYITFLSNISYYYFQLASIYGNQLDNSQVADDISQSMLFSDSAQHVAERIHESHLVLSMLHNNKAYLLSLQGKLRESIMEQRIACELSDKSTVEYIQLLQNLSLLYLFNGEHEEAIDIEKEAIALSDYRIKDNLKLISAYTISKYWSTLNSWYNNYIPKCAFYTRNKDAISYLYDKTALFAKEFLLNSSLSIQDLLQKEDTVALAIANKIQTLYFKLDSIKSDTGNIEDRERIAIEIKNSEDSLILESSAYRNYLDNIECHWHAVQEQLTKDDVAIEFLRCSLGLYNDSVLYIAMVLKKQYDAPVLIPLFNECKLSEPIISNSTERLYKLIWKPLECELTGVKNIYFSPAGILYNIGIEYLPYRENIYMNEKYNIYRLSSTKRLVYYTEKKRTTRAVLFGGISYDATETKDLVMDNLDVSQSPNKGIASAVSARNGFDLLSGTREEIESVADVLGRSSISSILYSNEQGSEYNFKKLSSEELGIIHLATHGMYVDFRDTHAIINRNNFTFISPNNSIDISGESNALTRSFLVMAGGNRLPRRMSIPNHGNDGILTALEISRMNLSSVDLVVLSACQSGLGDITDDGVLGLQRGFKKAGVNTILMSLDKVDDEATKMLMVEFYKNLMSGKSKLNSLRDAQKYLRQVENGKYNEPKYWASFILLDGLD